MKRAIDIFSPEMIGAIKSQHEQGVPGFEDIHETVQFMELVEKWWHIMDVSNTTQGTQQGLPDKLVFYLSDDDRLSWLEETFLPFLEEWKRQSHDQQFLSRETYEAIVLTTKCTIAIIRYLLDVKMFEFVLTRPFQSDKVEIFFSSVRQLNSSLYNVDAKGAVFAAEKMLRTNIARTAIYGNVRLETVKNQVNPELTNY